ncbi:hypothetical protein OBO34_21125 [Clostridiales Family XIII bacterium ASD5510]|uniref:Uncharacterized protein n=1 Tax=Hominibacterium faecale TaxID=2839743 RepID=A0A9J6QZC9_9FIRM|nr:hypothetical protein [Hominibacterium faecale]MCU7380820.1 hypothetical protein [Hominibacterium faecale]
MKESKKALVKDVTKEINAFPENKRNRVLDVMRGMLIMDQLREQEGKDKPKKTG